MTPEKIQELIRSFSRFPKKGNNGKFPVWIKKKKLAKNLETLLNQLPFYDSTKEYANAIFSLWQRNPDDYILQEHILAYLAMVCIYAAKKFSQKYQDYGILLEDYFQTGQTKIEKILNRFNPEKSYLYTYAYIIFIGSFKDYVRKECDRSAFRTDIWLLNCKSLRQTKKALKQYGLSEKEIEKYLLVRDYFNQIVPLTNEKKFRQLPPKNNFVWEQVAIAYNKYKLEPFPEYDEEDILRIIQTIIEAVVYCYFNNQPQSQIIQPQSSKPVSHDYLDDLIDAVVRVIKKIIKINKNNKNIGIREKEFAAEIMKILDLYYCQDLTFEETAKIVYGSQKNGYKARRRQQKFIDKLVEELITIWQQKNPDLCLTQEKIAEIREQVNKYPKEFFTYLLTEQLEQQ